MIRFALLGCAAVAAALALLPSAARLGAQPASRAARPAIAATPAIAPRFSDAERAAIVAFWNEPGRLRVALAPRGEELTDQRVRITPEASLWLWNYNRARGVGKGAALTQAAPAATAEDAARQAQFNQWEQWVAAKIAYDRALAQMAATPTIQIRMRPHPGSAPASLLAAVGNPPPFAAAVTPMQYEVRVDDGAPFVYEDWVKVNERSAYFRFSEGVRSFGTPVRQLPAAEVRALLDAAGLTPFEQNVVKAVSLLEGGFAAVNTYDTGLVSIGFIQFAALTAGGGSLAAVLNSQRRADAPAYERDFRRYGLDVTADGRLLVAVDPSTGAELTGPDAARKIIADKRLIAVFQRAGEKSIAFRAAQARIAKSNYYPANDRVTVSLDGLVVTGTVSDFIKSEAGMATLYDRKVNTGGIRPTAQVVERVMRARNLRRLSDLAPYEREVVTALRYRTNFLADTNLSQPPAPPQ